MRSRQECQRIPPTSRSPSSRLTAILIPCLLWSLCSVRHTTTAIGGGANHGGGGRGTARRRNFDYRQPGCRSYDRLRARAAPVLREFGTDLRRLTPLVLTSHRSARTLLAPTRVLKLAALSVAATEVLSRTTDLLSHNGDGDTLHVLRDGTERWAERTDRWARGLADDHHGRPPRSFEDVLLCAREHNAVRKMKKLVSDSYRSFSDSVEDVLVEELDDFYYGNISPKTRRRHRVAKFRALSPKTKAAVGTTTGMVLSPLVLRTSIRTLQLAGLVYLASEVIVACRGEDDRRPFFFDADNVSTWRGNNNTYRQHISTRWTRTVCDWADDVRSGVRKGVRSCTSQPTVLLDNMANTFDDEPAACLGLAVGSVLGFLL